MQRFTIIFCLIMLIAACRELNGQTTVPALLTNPGVDTLQEIEQTISAALNGVKVTLAPDVLTENSVLVIQHTMQHSIERPPELGRDLGRPYRFQLVTDGSQCVLVDMQSEQSWPLRSVKCVKE
jgi:outer membrane lipoprotein-sorting protein